MKEPGKKFSEIKSTSTYTSYKSKPQSLGTRQEKYSGINIEVRNLSAVQSPSSSYFRDTNVMSQSISSRTEDIPLTNQTRAYAWALALKDERLIPRLVTDDREIERVALDLPNQRVVKNDCNRTRVGTFDESQRDNLEKLLTFYCKRENITYKQGLNEVAAPFINFQKSSVNISNIYNYLVLFIDRFLPTSFIDKDFLSLQCYFRTLELLIKYHDPNFHTFLNIHDLPSELYATPWFLTLFASKMSLDMVYLLWDMFILENDTCFKFFIALALLLENKNLIIGSETSMIPQTIANLTVNSASQMKQIYKRAVQLRMKTPISFLSRIRELDIPRRGNMSDTELKMKMEKNVEYLESLQCVLISSYELINTIYYSEIVCSDPDCVNYVKSNMTTGGGNYHNNTYDSNKRALSLDIAKKERRMRKNNARDSATPYLEPTHVRRNSRKGKEIKTPCILCQAEMNDSETATQLAGRLPHLKELVAFKNSLKEKNEDNPPLDVLVIDLRQNKNAGELPKSNPVDFRRGMEETANLMINDYIEYQTKFHFVFMTSNFNSWVFKDSFESKNLRAKRGIKESLKSERSDIKGINASVEEEWMLSFLNAFVQNGFSYLSILEGGFNETNKNLHNLNLETINHHPDYCPVCRGSTESKGPSFFNIINKVIDKTGEKLGMLVEGINNNNNNSFADTTRSKGGRNSANLDRNDNILSRTSQGFLNPKIGEDFSSSAKPIFASRDRESKPRSLASVPTNTNIISESTQETGDHFHPSLSMYNSELNSGPSLGSTTSGLSKYLQGTYDDRSTRADREDSYRSSTGSQKPLYPQPKMGTQQSNYNKSNSMVYRNGPTSETKINISGAKSPIGFQTLSLGMYASPKLASHNDTIGSALGGSPTYQGSIGSPNSFMPQSVDTFGASKYVFEQNKRRSDEEDLSDDGRNKKDKRMGTVPGHSITKAKSNDKALGYGSYAAPSLAKMFKPVKQMEEEQKAKFYSTEFSMSNRPFGEQDRNNKTTYRDKNDRSFGGQKEGSLANSFQIDPLNESKNRGGGGGTGYLSSSKAFLESYTKQMNQTMNNSISKKGTITQILKESGTYGEAAGGDSTPSIGSYQPFVKPSSLIYSSNAAGGQVDYSPRHTADDHLKVPGSNLYLENLASRDLLSPREMNSLRSLTQSPSPDKLAAGKMSERMSVKSKNMIIDTALLYPNYTDMGSPGQADMMKNMTSRMEDGKASSRAIISNNYFENNGIFREFRLSQNGIFWLYKAFENMDFTFYTCNYMKDAFKDDSHPTHTSIGTAGGGDSSSNKRIIMVSKEFLVGVRYSQDIVEDLRLLQVGVSVERILKRAREKNYGGAGDMLSPKEFGYGSSNHEIVVEAIFPVKLLLRITSKKVDAKYLSFYFKLPTMEKLAQIGVTKYFNFSEQTIQELHTLMKKDEYLRALREISDLKDPGTILQSKSVYCFETSQDAQECIQKTRDAYSTVSTYLNEKLKRNQPQRT